MLSRFVGQSAAHPWLYWILASIVSTFIFYLAFVLADSVLAPLLQSSPLLISTYFPFVCLVAGIILGLAQGVILAPISHQSITLYRWTFATASGWLVASLLIYSGFIVDDAAGDLFYVLVGLLIGVIQWWLLRDYVDNAALWILVNGIAWGLLIPVHYVLFGASPFLAPEWGLVHGVVDGLVVGIVTGLGLIRLLKPGLNRLDVSGS